MGRTESTQAVPRQPAPGAWKTVCAGLSHQGNV